MKLPADKPELVVCVLRDCMMCRCATAMAAEHDGLQHSNAGCSARFVDAHKLCKSTMHGLTQVAIWWAYIMPAGCMMQDMCNAMSAIKTKTCLYQPPNDLQDGQGGQCAPRGRQRATQLVVIEPPAQHLNSACYHVPPLAATGGSRMLPRQQLEFETC
jgi:hypothetical protein